MTIPEHIELGQVVFDEIEPYLKEMPHLEKAILLARVNEILLYGVNSVRANCKDMIRSVISEIR